MKTFIAVAAVFLSLVSCCEAGEPKPSLAQMHPTGFPGGSEFTRFSKLTLAPAGFQVSPELPSARLSLGDSIRTNGSSVLPDDSVIIPLELPERKYFRNLHYVHEEWRIGNNLAGADSFGRLWKWKSSPKTDFVFPYCRWDYPSRSGERILIGVFWSRSF